MTDTLGNDSNVLDPNIRKQLKAAKKERRELKKAQEQIKSLQREAALSKAGVPDDERGRAFSRAYGGELDPEKIRSEFENLFGELPQPEDGTDTAKRIASAGQGQGQPGEGLVDFADALRAARGDNKKVMELLANAPEGAVGRIEGWQGRVAVPEIQ